MTDIESKLHQLRLEWTRCPEKRAVIELQAKTLKLAGMKKWEKIALKTDDLEEAVKSALF